ncbi:MAG TPA: hypothetical protein VJM31_08735 [Vicinamibacterales bacterium]|nr:hypothetical protein [Vicinamibacterales bacterium]
MQRERAIQQGIDSARMYRKDGPFEYPMEHPLFAFWWEAVVLKSDCPDLSDSFIRKDVMARLEKKHGKSGALDSKTPITLYGKAA